MNTCAARTSVCTQQSTHHTAKYSTKSWARIMTSYVTVEIAKTIFFISQAFYVTFIQMFIVNDKRCVSFRFCFLRAGTHSHLIMMCVTMWMWTWINLTSMMFAACCPNPNNKCLVENLMGCCLGDEDFIFIYDFGVTLCSPMMETGRCLIVHWWWGGYQ